MSERSPESLDDDLQREIEEALGDTSLLGVGPKTSPAASEAVPLGALVVPDDADPEPGSFADAKVSGVGEADVFVEFGPRAQGVVSADQFGTPPDVGEVVRVYVETFDAKDSLYLCSLKKTLQAASGWGSVEQGAVVVGTVRAVNSGGLTVQIGPLTGFLPASHLAVGRVEDLESVVGETFPVEVIESDPDRRKLVVSRRAILARERDEKAAATLDNLHEGDVISGTVSRIEKFGAFVDIGGTDGLVHVSQMAWTRVEHPDEVVKVGDVVKVQVLKVDLVEKRIGLGMKQLLEDPWVRFAGEHPAGSVLEGKVTRLAHFGAFLEVAEGVEGLAHVSQLSPNHLFSPKEVLKPGDAVAVRVMSIDLAARRISLSLLTERGDRLTDDVADDATIREVLDRSRPAEPTLGDLLKRAMDSPSDDA